MMQKTSQQADVGGLNLEETRPSPQCGLLDLDDFCLSNIISYLDCKAFQVFCQTCSRLNEVASDRHSWNSSVLFRRISYLIQSAWFEGWFEKKANNFKSYPKCILSNLMREGLNLGQSLAALSNGTVKSIWKENGPVIAKMYSYLVQFTTEEIHNHPQSNWLIRRKNFSFNLPSGDLVLQISTLDIHNHDYMDDTDSDDEVREEQENNEKPLHQLQQPIKIKGYQKGKCIVIFKSEFYDEPYTRSNTDTEDVSFSNDPLSLQPIIDMFTKSIPKANPLISPDILIDFLLSLPHKPMKPVNAYFLSTEDNVEPRWDRDYFEGLTNVRKSCIELYHTRSSKFLDLARRNTDLSKELIYHLGILLEKRSTFLEYVDRCYHASAKIGFDLLLVNEKAVRSLVRRIDFIKSTCNFDSVDVSECKVEMKMVGSQVLKISSSWINDTGIGMEDKMVNIFHIAERDNVLLEWKVDPLLQSTEAYEVLGPVTRLLQCCIDADPSCVENIPQLTNLNTARFFIAMVKGLTKGISGIF